MPLLDPWACEAQSRPPLPAGMELQPAVLLVDEADDLPPARYTTGQRVAAALLVAAFAASTVWVAFSTGGRHSLLINGGAVAPPPPPR